MANAVAIKRVKYSFEAYLNALRFQQKTKFAAVLNVPHVQSELYRWKKKYVPFETI